MNWLENSNPSLLDSLCFVLISCSQRAWSLNWGRKKLHGECQLVSCLKSSSRKLWLNNHQVTSTDRIAFGTNLVVGWRERSFSSLTLKTDFIKNCTSGTYRYCSWWSAIGMHLYVLFLPLVAINNENCYSEEKMNLLTRIIRSNIYILNHHLIVDTSNEQYSNLHLPNYENHLPE